MKLFNFVDKAFYINLKSRQDKRDLVEEHFQELGILEYIERKEAYTPEDLGYTLLENGKYHPESYGLALLKTQIEIIEYAKKANLNNVLIFEDDVRFNINDEFDVIETIHKGLETLSTIEDWDVCHLGTNPGNAYDYFEKVSDNLVKTVETIAAHSIIINSSVFDFLIDNHKHQKVFDVWSSRAFSKKYLCYPMCTYQAHGIPNDIHATIVGYGYTKKWWESNYKKRLV